MDHVAGAREAMQGALSYLTVKSGRLFIDVDQPIFLACDDNDRHCETGVILARCKGIEEHESTFSGAGANL